MAPDKPSIVTTYSHEGKRYLFYIFEVTKYIFEVTKYIFEVTGTFRKGLYIRELQRPPNSNILLAYLCIYVVRLLYTKAKEKEKGFEAFLFLLLNHTKHTAESSGTLTPPGIKPPVPQFLFEGLHLPKSTTSTLR